MTRILDVRTKFYKVLKKEKIFFVGDKPSLSFRSASSGLKENDLTYNFIQYISIFYNIIKVNILNKITGENIFLQT